MGSVAFPGFGGLGWVWEAICSDSWRQRDRFTAQEGPSEVVLRVGSRLARQEARREAVLAARGPKCRFYQQFKRNRRFCAAGSRGVGCRQGVPTYKVPNPQGLTA